MPEVSYQTIKLGRGKHSSPQAGACVIELASILAGEPFSDHPQSVSRPIAAFLRGYNDMLDDERRQDLYAYAAEVVNTAASCEVEDARVKRLLAWGDERRRRRLPPRPFSRSRRRRARQADPDKAAAYALHAIAKLSKKTHAAVLALVDELIAIGSHPELDVPGEHAQQPLVTEPIMPSP